MTSAMQPSDRQPDYDPGVPGQPALATASGAPPPRSGSGIKGLGGIAALVLGVLAKGKGLLLALKALPLAKLLLTGGSMAASVALYAVSGGWAFAFGLVLMIFIHELGHGLAMRRAGIESGWPVFIPFFGAMIAMKGRPNHPRVEADIAFAGPLAGTAIALAAAALGLLVHSPFFFRLAYVGFFLNLFNLTPIGFLDGGRIARVLSRKASIVGAIVMGGLCLLSPSPQLVVIAAMALMHTFQRDNADLELVTPQDRKTWALRYFGLCAFLALALMATHQLTSVTPS
jgi:Zn-dependent protease